MDGSSESDAGRISRRNAMKAALAGAAAAAVWQAPRIEGLSIAPDVAQAASCTGGTGGTSRTGTGVLLINCWGNNTVGLFCDPQPLTAITIPKGAPQGGNWVISLTVDGSIQGPGDGAFQYNLNGIDPTFQQCNINVTGVCTRSNGTFVGPAQITLNSNVNTSPSASIFCNGIANSTGTPATVTFSVVCTCA